MSIKPVQSFVQTQSSSVPCSEHLAPAGFNSTPFSDSHLSSLDGRLQNGEAVRLGLRLLGGGLTSSALGLFSFAMLGMISWTVGLVAIPCTLGALGVFWYSSRTERYDNPNEMERIRAEAGQMDLSSVMQTYGWNDVLRFGILSPELFAQKYRQHLKDKSIIEIIAYYERTLRHFAQCSSLKYEYVIPTPKEFAKKWREETASITFEEIISSYSLDTLEKYAMVEHNELCFLRKLKQEYDAMKQSRDEKLTRIESEYRIQIAPYQRTYEAERTRVEQIYNNHPAVRELQGFELHYNRERQLVQAGLNRAKSEARAAFDWAMSSYTNQGLVSYNELSLQAKAIYDQKKREMEMRLSAAEAFARIQIEQIDIQRNQRHAFLSQEEMRVKAARETVVGEAKKRFDADVLGFLQHKEQRSLPIEGSFRSAARDLNARYGAYLRIMGRRH